MRTQTKSYVEQLNPKDLYQSYLLKYGTENAILYLIFWLQEREAQLSASRSVPYRSAKIDLSVMYAKRTYAGLLASDDRQDLIDVWNLIIAQYIEKHLDREM